MIKTINNNNLKNLKYKIKKIEKENFHFLISFFLKSIVFKAI